MALSRRVVAMPPKKVPYSDFFDETLTRDVEELLSRFQGADSVRYSDFSLLWREMRFADVFLGICRSSEAKSFTKVSLATAIKYFLPPYSFQIRVGGLYLMFGFYHTQLVVPPVNIRLALKDRAAVQKFLVDSLDAGHYDIVYVYEKLVAAKAFHYTAMPHHLHFQKQKKPKRDPVCASFLGRTSAVHDFLSVDLLEELSNVHLHYTKLKESTVEVGPRVNMSQRDLVPSLEKCLKEFMTWQRKTFSGGQNDKNTDDEGDEEEEEKKRQSKAESSSRVSLLQSIKQKSFQNLQVAPKSRRHRQTQVVDSPGSGAEQVPEGPKKWQRPPSLRARTWKSLGVPEEETKTQAWLLSAPEEWESRRLRGTSKRTTRRCLNLH